MSSSVPDGTGDAIISPNPSLTSSFDLIPSHVSRSSVPDADTDTFSICSDDEIVWSFSEGSLASSSSQLRQANLTEPVEDFVVLSGGPSTVSAAAAEDELVIGLSGLAITKNKGATVGKDLKRKKKPRKKAAKARAKAPPAQAVQLSPTPSPDLKKTAPADTPAAQAPPQKRKPKKAKKRSGLDARPIVDDTSEIGSENRVVSPMYDDAVQCISTFLSSPESRAATSPLRLLQAFIIELGLCPASAAPALPASLRAAKALLKSRAFLNVRDYLAVREQGLPALQRIMYPSRTALSKDIRTKKKTVSPRWAKKHGLHVFLVTCFH